MLFAWDKQNTTQKNWGHRVQKTKTNKTQHRETGNIGYKRLRRIDKINVLIMDMAVSGSRPFSPCKPVPIRL